MAKINSDCIEAAFTALRGFTREELQDYAQQVFVRASKYEDVSNMKAFDRAMEEINNERLRSYFEDVTTKANNIMKFDRQAKRMGKGRINMRGLITSRDRFNKEGNLAAQQKADTQDFYNHVLGDLTNQEVDHFTSGKFDEDILNTIDGHESNDPMTRKIADKIKDWFTYRNAQLVLSNAMKFDEINEDRYFRAIHDSTKMINGAKSLRMVALERIKRKYRLEGNKDKWREFIKKHLDMDGTFEHTQAMGLDGELDISEADKILNRIFDNITTKKSDIFTRSVVANDREAVANRSRMFFKWKDMTSQFEYNKVYGSNNTLYGMFDSDLRSAARKTGIAKMWGDNPYTVYNDLRKVQQSTDGKSRGAYWWRNTDNYLKTVMGGVSEVSPNMATIGGNIRAFTSMARLPLLGLDARSDIGYAASFAQRIGISYTKAWTTLLADSFKKIPTEEQARIAKLMGASLKSHLGYLGRWGEANSMGAITNKITTAFFKHTFLEGFDEGEKAGVMTLMAKHLFENSKDGFDTLQPELQKWVSKFLDSNEWDLLRQKNQGGLFTTDNVDNLSDAELRAHYATTEKDIPLSSLRDDLYRKVHAMFSIAAENAVLSPTEFERTFIYQGSEPGTPTGEFWRTIGQFKMYGLSFIDRVLVDGFKEADTATQKLKWAASLFIGTLPLSVATMFLHNAFMGLSMPDWDQMNVPEREKYLLSLIAPSLSMFSGILDSKGDAIHMLWSLIGSPSGNLIANTLNAMNPGTDSKQRLKSLQKAIGYIIPLNTTPLITPWIHKAMGDKAYVEPGQTHYFGQ